jgi:hypothetical protein
MLSTEPEVCYSVSESLLARRGWGAMLSTEPEVCYTPKGNANLTIPLSLYYPVDVHS